MKLRNFIILDVLLVIIGFFAFVVGSYLWKEHQVQVDEQRRVDLYSKILDGASIQPIQLTIDFSKQTSTGSPLIFGGAHSPKIEHEDAWDKLQEVNATLMRTDFYLEHMVSKNTTITDYKNNKENVQNIDTWQSNYINSRNELFRKAKTHGMKTMGIISFAPDWLTYSHTRYGVPIDWGIYEDIVRKAYAIYRDNIDFVEIWNEPTHNFFLNVKGSRLTQQEAYSQIFYHASKAIRDVDNEKDGKNIPIGAQVSHNADNTTVLEYLLKNDPTHENIDFISYHNYDNPEPSWDNFKKVLDKNNLNNIPIFLTEWNYDSREDQDNPHKTANEAILFTGNKLLDFLKMGLAGANYFAFIEKNDGFNGKNKEYLAFFQLKDHNVELLPQARTWRILSKQMGLGKGQSMIYEVKQMANSEGQIESGGEVSLAGVVEDMLSPETLNSLGFRNVDGQYGTAIVNSSQEAKMVEVNLENTGIKNYAKVQVYYATAGNEAKVPVYEGTLKAEKGKIKFAFYIPEESVVGISFTEEKEWFENLPIQINNLIR